MLQCHEVKIQSSLDPSPLFPGVSSPRLLPMMRDLDFLSANTCIICIFLTLSVSTCRSLFCVSLLVHFVSFRPAKSSFVKCCPRLKLRVNSGSFFKQINKSFLKIFVDKYTPSRGSVSGSLKNVHHCTSLCAM